MNILLVTLNFPPHSFGGTGAYAYELARILASRNTVHVMTCGKSSGVEKVTEAYYVHRYKCSFKPFLRLPSFLMQVLRNANRLIKGYEIDIIHSNDVEACFLLGKLPSTVTIHHISRHNFSRFSLSRNLKNLLYVIMENMAVNISDRIISVSHLTRKQLLEVYKNVESKIRVVNVPVDLSRFEEKSTRERGSKCNVTDNRLLLLCPGGAREERKGGTCLLDALERFVRVSDFMCIITGRSREGKWDQRMRVEAERRGLKHKTLFTGELSFDSLVEYYLLCDIVVFPSLFEGYGFPTLEAMAAAKPVIASRTGEAPYLIQHGFNGLLVDTGDANDLFGAMQTLAASESLRKEIGRNGREYVERNMSESTVAGKIEDIYTSILS